MSSHDYLYGINPVFEAVGAQRRRIHRAFVAEGAAPNPRLRKLMALLADRQTPVERADKRRLFDLCRTTEHQGVVAETEPYPLVAFETLLGEPRLLLLDNVEDPQNVGAILRSAEFFGWPAVLLPVKGVPEIYPSVVKASAGAVEHLRIARDRSANAYLRRLREEQYTVVALDENGRESLSETAARSYDRLALVIGGEHRSVGQFILNAAQHVARIERRGRVQSLNASVAAGLALAAFRVG